MPFNTLPSGREGASKNIKWREVRRLNWGLRGYAGLAGAGLSSKVDEG